MPLIYNDRPVEAIVYNHLYRRTYCPTSEYNGDRPCLWWPPLLMRLAARGLIGKPSMRLTQFPRRK